MRHPTPTPYGFTPNPYLYGVDPNPILTLTLINLTLTNLTLANLKPYCTPVQVWNASGYYFNHFTRKYEEGLSSQVAKVVAPKGAADEEGAGMSLLK